MRVAILASGSGSNAAALMNHFSNTEGIDVVLVGSNRSSAGVLEKANQAGIKDRLGFACWISLENPRGILQGFRK